MDSFTEGILERAKKRQQKLLGYNLDDKHSPLLETNQNHPEDISSELEKSTMEVSSNKTSTEENVRLEVEFEEGLEDEGKENYEVCVEKTDEDGNNEDVQPLRANSKKRLQRLGELYAGGDDANISSPIHRTEATFSMDSPTACHKPKACPAGDSNRNLSKGSNKGLGGLASLAQSINQWEDNISKAPKNKDSNNSAPKKKSWKPPAPKPPTSSSMPITLSPKKAPAPKPPVTTTGNKTAVKTCTNETQQLSLDPSVVETLESQGFSRTISNSRLIFSYDSESKVKKAEITNTKKNNVASNCIEEESASEEEENLNVKQLKTVTPNNCNSPVKNNVTASIANRAALFEKAGSSPIKNANTKDPALLSVSERKALFEKNKGSAPVPKAPISMATPIISTKQFMNNNLKSNLLMKKQLKSLNENNAGNKESEFGPEQNNVADSAYKISSGQPGGIASKVAALFQNKGTISQEQIKNDIKEQRQREMDVLLNRFNTNKVINEAEVAKQLDLDKEHIEESTVAIVKEVFKNDVNVSQSATAPEKCGKKRRSSGKRNNVKEASPKVQAALEDVKRIKVTSKPGRLYPCLSDIEATTEPETENNTASPTPENSSMENNESDLEALDTSFGREVLETVCKNQTPLKRGLYDLESDESDILDGSDDYLDEVMAFNSDSMSGPTPPKQSRSLSPVNTEIESSNSFQYKKFSPRKMSSKKELTPKQDFRTPLKNSPRKSEEHNALIVEGDSVLSLTHTVSFYRKQQTQQSQTPVRQIIRYPVLEESPESDKKLQKIKIEVKKKIADLERNIEIYSQTIQQTSQGLKCCYSTPEFTRSTEQVEFERVLLLATQRRLAAQREIERLKVLETYPNDNSMDPQEGNLIISNIALPLKRKYMKALNATGGKGHHVVCLVKCGHQVQGTCLFSISATNDENVTLKIPGTIVLNNVPSNFTVQFEVYCLIAEEESLPHEVKYHIKNNKKATPKKTKAELRLIRPPMESPESSQSVRTSTFASVGFVIFDIQTMNQKNWTLNNAPSKSPLEGKTEMRVKYELTQLAVECRGFLNILDYLSDKAIWHRRWYLLKDDKLYSWKYPQDEKERDPIDIIDLKYATTREVTAAPRNISSRLFTIMVEITRPYRPDDRSNTLVKPDGDVTFVRYVFAADSQAERVNWNTNFNKVLTAIRLSNTSK